MSGLLHRLLFPPKCAACKELTDWYVEHPALCNSCKKVWDNEKSDVCCICGERVSLCACLTEEMKRAKCASFHKLVYYYPQKRQIVQNRVLFSVKEKKVSETFSFLSEELLGFVDAIRTDLPDADFGIVYLPRSKEQKRKYGLDQAELLARALSKRTDIPVICAIKRTGGVPQKNLSGSARLKNAKASFAFLESADVQGKTLFLMDDIVTTGAGMSVATQLLRAHGAKAVHCLAIASDVSNREIV